MDFEFNRPEGHTGKGDQYLPEIIEDIEKFLLDVEETFEYETLVLPDEDWCELASVLVEFAEDIHNNIGIWNSFEHYNLEFFGTKLPLTSQPGEDMDSNAISSDRIHHLLWVLYSELNTELILAPTYKDLVRLSKRVSSFLKDRFAKVPKDSGVKKFLAQPNKYGWDVKRKLVWLGQHSYLFRNSFYNYIEDNGGEAKIPIIDDFVNQQTTCWSGLGVIDILAATLNITKKQKKDLRSWYERHMAFFKVLSVKSSVMEVLNIINDKRYTIRISNFSSPFKPNDTVTGSVVPWNGEWYWSGIQSKFRGLTEKETQEVKKDFIKNSANVVYRYDKALLKQAKKSLKNQYDDFVKYKGKDLVVYPDGLSMAADMEKWYRLQYESKPKDLVEEHIKKHNLSKRGPRMSFPQEILETEDGIGVFFNPDEGQEMMMSFNYLLSGLEKKGENLTEDEEETIRGFIYSNAISPRFVKKLVQEYGDESIAASFLIRNIQDKFYLDYLLRRHKGHFYRNTYPGISLII